MTDAENQGTDGNNVIPTTPDETNEMGGNDDDNMNTTTNNDNEDDFDPNAAAGTSDGLIGSRRIRTFLIGGLLIAYSLFAMITYFKGAGSKYFLVDSIGADLLDSVGGAVVTTIPKMPGFAKFAYVLAGLGCLVILFSASAAIVLHCMKKEGGIETITGWVLFGGSVTLLVGQIFLMFYAKRIYGNGGAFFIFVGQGMLGAVTGIFLALDVIKDFMAKEERRLFWNLLVLIAVSSCCMIGYSVASGNASSKLIGKSGGYAVLAIGYTFILGFSLTYCILNFFDCITCNLDDNKCVRLILAGGLLAGGVLTGIGYFASSTKLAWGEVFGFAILIIGLCGVWALDMGIVDKAVGNKNASDE